MKGSEASKILTIKNLPQGCGRFKVSGGPRFNSPGYSAAAAEGLEPLNWALSVDSPMAVVED